MTLGWQCPVCKRVYAPFVQECMGEHGGTTTAPNTESTVQWAIRQGYIAEQASKELKEKP